MPNPQNILQTLQSDLKKMTPVSYLSVKPGDTLARVSDGTVALFTLASLIGDKASTAEGGALFLAGNGIKLYLIDRPKVPLPTKKGARIVVWRVDDDEFPQGELAFHDGHDISPWCATNGNEYEPEEIEEWAPLPDGYFNELRKGANK